MGEIKHWGIGGDFYLCGRNSDLAKFSPEAENVNCLECLKEVINHAQMNGLFYYPWIPDKIKELQYKQDFANTIKE